MGAQITPGGDRAGERTERAPTNETYLVETTTYEGE